MKFGFIKVMTASPKLKVGDTAYLSFREGCVHML